MVGKGKEKTKGGGGGVFAKKYYFRILKKKTKKNRCLHMWQSEKFCD